MTQAGLGKCKICGTPSGDPHPFRHQFTLKDGDLQSTIPQKKEPAKITYAGDIALRKLLLDKGLITGPELEAANAEMQALLGGVRGPNDRR